LYIETIIMRIIASFAIKTFMQNAGK